MWKRCLWVLLGCFVLLFVGYMFRRDYNRLAELSKRAESLQEVVREVGDEIYLKVKDRWIPASDVYVSKWKLLDPIMIEYDGEEIYIGETPLSSIVRVLYRSGLLRKS